VSSSTPDQDAPAPDGAVPAGTPGEATSDRTAPDGGTPAAEQTAPTDDSERNATEPDAAEPDGEAADAPRDVTLLVDPERVRRAPKYPVFLWMGALVGAVAGLIFAVWLVDATDSAETLMKPGVYVSVTVLGGIALGLGVAGLIAVISDRRSLRRR
jgi:hypothetical protein